MIELCIPRTLRRGRRAAGLCSVLLALVCAGGVSALLFAGAAAQGRDLREDTGRTDVAPTGPGNIGRLTLPQTPQKYPRLDSTLNALVADYEAGRLAAQDATSPAPTGSQTGIAVTVYASTNVSAIRTFLENNGGAPRNVGATYIEAYVPVGLLGRLSQQPGVRQVRIIIPPVAHPAPVIGRDLGRETSAGTAPAAGTGANEDTASVAQTTGVSPSECGN